MGEVSTDILDEVLRRAPGNGEGSIDILELVFRDGLESGEPSSIDMAFISDPGDLETDTVAEMLYAWLFHPRMTVCCGNAVVLGAAGIWL